MKNNKKALSILLCVLLVICALGTAAILAWDHIFPSSNDPDNEPGAQVGVVVSDEEALRAYLLEETSREITLTEDITVDEPLIVNGTKTLMGTGSITMELYVKPYLDVLVVKENAALTLDGIKIHGNGIANCVEVAKKAKLTVSSGEIVFGSPYGIEANGEVVIHGGSIHAAVHTGVFVASGASVKMEGGNIRDGGYCGVKVAVGGYMSISDDAVVQDCNNYLVHNSGVCDITGGVLRDSNYTMVYTDGEMNVAYQGSDADGMLEWFNARGSGIYVDTTGILNADRLYIHDVGVHGVNSAKGYGEIHLSNCVFEDVGHHGIYARTVKTSIQNVKLANTGKHGLYVNASGAEVAIDALTVTNAGERGIHNVGGTVTAKNVSIDTTGLYGVSTASLGETAGSVTIDGLTVTGSNGDSAINCYKSVLTVTGAQITDSAKVGARATDGGTINLTDVKITNTGDGYDGILVNSNAQATLQNIEVTNAGKHGVFINGSTVKAVISNLTVTEPAERGLHNAGGTVEASNVTILSSGLYGVSTGNAKNTPGSVTIDGLTVTGAQGDSAVNCYQSVLNVSNAKISGTAKVGARVTDGGTLNLNNVTITDTGSHAVFVYGPGSKATVDGLKVQKSSDKVEFSATRGIYNAGGTVNASNVEVDAAKEYGISAYRYKDAEGAVTGGSMTVANLTVTNSLGSVLHVNSSELTVTGAKITETAVHGALANYGGVLTLSDVTMDGVGRNGIYVDGATGETTVKLNTVSIANAGTHGLYVNGSEAKAYADGLTITTTDTYTLNPDVEYGDIRVSAGGYAEVKAASITGSKEDGVYVDSGSELHLTGINSIADAGKYGVFANGVNAKISINVHEGAKAETDNLTISNTAQRGIHNVGGTINAKNVTVTNPGTYGVSTGNSGDTAGSVTIGNLKVEGAKGDSAVNCYQSVLSVNGAVITDSAKIGARATDGGVMNLTDVQITKTGSGYEGILINSKAQATLKNVEVTNAGKHGVYVDGAGVKAVISGLTVTEPAQRGLHNAGGTVEASNVTILSSGLYGVSTGNSGDTAGSVTIDALTVTGAKGDSAVNCYNSVLNVSNAKISGTAKVGARVTDGGTLNLTNVTITDTGSHAVFVYGPTCKANIDGLKVQRSSDKVASSAARGIYNVGGTVTAVNVEVDAAKEYGVSTHPFTDKEGKVTTGTATVTNLTVTGSQGNAAVYSNNAVLNVTDAVLSGSAKDGALVNYGGVLNMTDVVIEDTVRYGVFVDGASGKSSAELKSVEVIDCADYGVCVKGADGTANISMFKAAKKNTDYCATRAIYNEGGTVVAADVTIDSAKTYAVSTYKGGSVTVTNLTASNSLGSALHVNSSKLTVNGAKITDTAAHGALANYGGELTLSDVAMVGVGENGVYVDGVSGKTTADITRLTLSDVGESGVYVNGVDGKADINVLTILKPEGSDASVKRGIYNIGGTVTAYDVTIGSASSYGVQSEVYVDDAGTATQGSVTVEKLSVSGTQGNAAVYSKNSVLTVNEAVLTDSQKDGALVNNGGTLNLTKVEINGAARHGIYVDGVNGGSVSNLSEVSITNAGFHGVFVNGADGEAYMDGLTVTTTNTYTLDKDAEYGDIRVSAGGYAEVEAATITGSKEHGMYVDSTSELHLAGINSIEDTGKHGVFANGANANIFINVQEGATKDTDKLSIANTGERGIHNASGTIEAANVTVTTPGTYGVSTGGNSTTRGSVTVDNLTVDGGNQNTQPAVNSYNSVLTVTNSTIVNSKGIGARVTDGGELNLENVSITNSGTDGVYIVHAGSAANVSGVKINGTTGGNGINVAGGTLNMSGINTITKAKTAGVYVAVNAAANINVHEGASSETDKLTITNGERGIYNVGGTVNAANVTVETMSSYGVQSEYFETTKGSVTVTNLSVTKAVSGAYTKGSVLTVTGATITDSTVHGTLANFGGVLTLTDVTIDGTGDGKNAVNIDGNSGATEAYLNNVTVTNVSNYGVLAYGADGYVEIDGLKVVKAEGATISSKRGLCNNGSTIKANDVQIDSAEKYSVSSWAYEDKAGNKTSGTMTITNLTVTNSKETALHANNSTVAVTGATITNTANFAAFAYTDGVLELTNVTIDTAKVGAQNSGGTIKVTNVTYKNCTDDTVGTITVLD